MVSASEEAATLVTPPDSITSDAVASETASAAGAAIKRVSVKAVTIETILRNMVVPPLIIVFYSFLRLHGEEKIDFT